MWGSRPRAEALHELAGFSFFAIAELLRRLGRGHGHRRTDDESIRGLSDLQLPRRRADFRPFLNLRWSLGRPVDLFKNC